MKNKKIVVCVLVMIVACVSFAAEPKITLYGAPWCPLCAQLEKYLTKQNIKFEKFNIDENDNAKQEAIRKSEQTGVPVLDWDGEIIIGFGNRTKKELRRLMDGGTPMRPDSVPSQISPQNNNTPTPPIDHFHSQTRDLDNFFAVAEQHVQDVNSADIMKKLHHAHKSRIIYESTFTEHFKQRVEDAAGQNIADKGEIIETAKVIAANKYIESFEAFRIARTKDVLASVTAQKTLRFVITYPDGQGNKDDNCTLNPKGQCYFLKLWSCAAVNPGTGNQLQPTYSAQRQDATSDKAGKILDEMAKTQQKVDAVEPNNLLAEKIQSGLRG